ncbi:ATP-binding cassette domain-containing protein [Aggregicoccus sp. 17bor-14]|uniref:ABC transporter ATP-binding protein n=1 Tax=Myxococcaceae TaxID=31 RepID=UPI00129CA796|nr:MULTISPECIES: ATP-binding cassette domain-containing protein [Myxococcaceae]MBF5042104.1 ATP-binding cassette domain-containing protein [Simulacricoccus sp. 17bor-14]MRI87881.1 ATP-binding cassette domain-containing protein [Aggregicoccus sp. 17bor-14]
MISVKGLRKHYQVHKRPPGLKAALRSLVHRDYTTVKAVDGISFDIRPGERVGFLGPNGAGKTTTLKVLSGLLHPSEGEVRVDGHVPRHREDAFLKKIMLVMGQKQQLLWDLPPSETFELNRAIYDVPMAQYRRTVDELVGLLELGDLIGKPTRQLSLGERMKCELAAALIHRPKVLFLDEPTIGLDVSMQVTMRRFIKAYNESTGATLILTSHYMDDVAALCPRVVVIDKGQLSYDGGLEALAQRVRPEKRVVLRLEREVDAAALAPLGKVVTHEAGMAVLQVSQEAVNATVARALGQLPVLDLTVENAPLEEVMSELFSQNRAARLAAPAESSAEVA